VRPSLQWTLDAITTTHAIVGNDRLDFLAANHLGRAMYADLLLDPTAPPNFARYTFLDSSARRFYSNWDLNADMTVANLRTAAGRDPHDRRLHELVGELSTRSEEFRRRWHAHDVRTHGTGVKNTSTTTSWATSSSRTKVWICGPSPVSPSPCTPPPLAHPPPMPLLCSPPGLPPRPKTPLRSAWPAREHGRARRVAARTFDS